MEKLNAIVPLLDIREVRPATKDDFGGCIRLFGNGGLFGYYGLFRTSKLGPSGMKEGPYDWVPPNYWYDTSHAAGGDQTNSGGSWALDT